VRVEVRGRVQGVFFRAEARARAESLGLSGWIRNDPAGSVTAVFDGDPERVQSMVDWCRRGPAGARVDEIRVTDEVEAEEARGGFRVI
jgi:acylphosphatase